MPDLTQYGTVSKAPPDLSAYGTVAAGIPAKRESTGSVTLDALAGIGSGAARTLIGAYKLLRMVPGVGDRLPAPNEFIEGLSEAPDSMAGHLGQVAEQTGEFLIPATKAAKISEGANLITKMAAQAVAAGGTRAVQTGGDVGQAVDAAAAAASVPVMGAVGGAIGSKISALVRNNPGLTAAATKAAPDVVGMVSPRLANVMRAGARVAGAVAPAAETAAEPDAELLNGIAQGYRYKSFAAAPADAQQIIRNQAEAIKSSQLRNAILDAQKPAVPAAVSPSAGARPIPQTPSVAPAPMAAAPSRAEILKRQLADEMLKSGSATPEMIAPAGSNQAPSVAANYESAARASKTQAFSQMLYDEGMTSRKVANWTDAQWAKAAEDRGLPAFSRDSRGKTIAMLRKLEARGAK